MGMKAYAIVEFEDRVEMVPTTWLSKDKKSCIWPDMKDQIRISDIIAAKETPDSYNTSNVLTIFGSADTYELGKEILKLAKQISDISSDTGAEDARALKKAETGSAGGKFSPKKSHISDQHQRNSHEDGKGNDIISKNRRETLINDDGTDLILDKQPNESRANGRKSGATLKIANGQQSDCTLSRAVIQNDNKLLEIEMRTQSEPTKSLSLAERQTSERTVTLEQLYDILREVCLKLNSLESKMTTVEVGIGDLREIVSTSKSTPTCDADLDDHGLPFGTSEALKEFEKKSSDQSQICQIQSRPICDADLDAHGLPFVTSGALKEFEKKLSVPDVRQSVVEALEVIRGTKLQSITSNILAKIMHNGLAEGYSFKGKKGKIPFNGLINVVNLIKDVVRKHKPHFTDKDIEEAIGKWLAQAKTRRLAEEKKSIREAIRKQSVEL